MRIGAMILFLSLIAPCLVLADGKPFDQNNRFAGGFSTIIALNKEQPSGDYEYVGYAAAEKFIRRWLLLSEKDDSLDAGMGF